MVIFMQSTNTRAVSMAAVRMTASMAAVRVTASMAAVRVTHHDETHDGVQHGVDERDDQVKDHLRQKACLAEAAGGV
jgi:hypothetical protein